MLLPCAHVTLTILGSPVVFPFFKCYVITTTPEHTFDLSLVGAAYPGLSSQEESMEECFRRRRYFLQSGW